MRRLALYLIFLSCSEARVKELEAKYQDSPIIQTKDFKKEPDPPDSIIYNYDMGDIQLKDVDVLLKSGIGFRLQILSKLNLNVSAQGLKRLRFLARSPDGRLFATDLFDKSDNRKGRVLIFSDWNDTLKIFNKVITYLDSLHNPNQIGFYDGYIYIAETGKLTRIKYQSGDDKPQSVAEQIATFPSHGLSYKYGGWHLTRSLTFNNNKVYVSIGSSCNACVEKEDLRAVIIEMNPDGSQQKIFARGLRNSVGIKWIGNELWVTSMGRDLIGPDKPEDLFQKIQEGGHYGWPYFFQYKNKIYADQEFSDSIKPKGIDAPSLALCGFKAHSAPLGFEYLKNFNDSYLKNSILVCLHGSTSVWRQRGNSIVKVGKRNQYIEIVTGFLQGKTENSRFGRPCDILMWNESSFFFTDDHNGVLYYVWK